MHIAHERQAAATFRAVLRQRGTAALLAVLLALAVAPGAAGQGAPPLNQLQAGLGVLPGVGLQTGYLSPRSFYTAEGVFYADVSPGFAGGEGSVQLSLGLGGALRPLGILRTLGNAGYTGYDIDVGLRFGPSLFFPFNDTRATKNQRFSLFLEPFVRFSSGFGTSRTFFVEAGIQRPLLRAGLWFDL